jgi:hypothetical protein
LLETRKTAPITVEFGLRKILKRLAFIGAGEGNRTLDTQLGNPGKIEDNQE